MIRLKWNFGLPLLAIIFCCASSVSSRAAVDAQILPKFTHLKVGLVDVNKVLQMDPEVRNLQKNIQKQFQAQGEELLTLRKALLRDVNILENKPAKLTEQRKLLAERVSAEAKALQTNQVKLQNDLNSAQKIALASESRRLNAVVKKVAELERIDLIVVKSIISYRKSNESTALTEITDQVIKNL